jgi:DNA replication factor GINS
VYEQLYNSWLREKEHTELQALPKDFYAKLAEYISSIQKEMRMLERNSPKLKLLSQELTKTTRLTHELVELRLRKIIDLSKSSENPQYDLPAKEEETVQKLRVVFEGSQRFLNKLMKGKTQNVAIEGITPRNSLLRFLQKLPTIVGVDLKIYGPFSDEDVAVLPTENAEALIKQGVAVNIEI